MYVVLGVWVYSTTSVVLVRCGCVCVVNGFFFPRKTVKICPPKLIRVLARKKILTVFSVFGAKKCQETRKNEFLTQIGHFLAFYTPLQL